MALELSLGTPLGQRLNDVMQPKLIELGWSTGGPDDSALAEYIILMLVNGKTQEQLASELSGDLLGLPPDDPGARDFTAWLFQQVDLLRSEGSAPAGSLASGVTAQDGEQQDADMGEGADTAENNAVPTGPKSMRSGGAERGREKRMLGHLGKAMDRSSDPLHRVRPRGGNERINTHARAPPTGPRSNSARGGRMNAGRGNMAPGPVPVMTPQQQMEIFSMLEQQSRMMAQMFTPQQQQMMAVNGGATGPMNGGMSNGFPQQQQQQQQSQRGKSLFDRVQPNRGRQNGFGRGHGRANVQEQPQAAEPATSAMDMELTPVAEKPSPDSTCKYNLACTNKDCKFAHQSPAAPPGTAIDVSDVCSFGAACKNRKCTGRHPSPAQKVAHQVEQDCKFFPNCTNPRCPFRHPAMPLCRNGADCTTENCKFTHVKTACKFNPCLNPVCPFKHEEGQKRGKFDDKVWVSGEQDGREHVSERKFVSENGAEELIVPGSVDNEMAHPEEIIT